MLENFRANVLKRYCESSRYGRFEAKQPKRYLNHLLTPERYDEHPRPFYKGVLSRIFIHGLIACMSLSPYWRKYDRRRHRRSRVYAITSNTPNNDNTETESTLTFPFLSYISMGLR